MTVGKRDFSDFGIQSMWGVTKHLGGRKATERLVELCTITPESRVLEVGCGVGITACYVARRVGCSLTSVDLNKSMIVWARKRAEREGLTDRIAFRVCDAQDLPFGEGSFDVVISKSVTAFASDKPAAVSEYRRVLKPGGRVGLTEASWMKTPPPAELVAFVNARWKARCSWSPRGGWGCSTGGFAELRSEVSHLTALGQLASDLNGQSWRDVADRFRAVGAFVRQYVTDRDRRRYARTLMPSGRTMRDLVLSRYRSAPGVKEAVALAPTCRPD